MEKGQSQLTQQILTKCAHTYSAWPKSKTWNHKFNSNQQKNTVHFIATITG